MILIFALNSGLAQEQNKQIDHWCLLLSKELRSVHYEKCKQRPWRLEGESLEKRPIFTLQWPAEKLASKENLDANVKEKVKGRSKIMIIGAIHGDEISAVSMVFRWIDFLERTKADSFLREHEYYFIPLANPDGFFASPRTRTNAAGVDLNRNFATKEWSAKALLYWKKQTGSDRRRYPGKSAASEVETRLVQKAFDEFQPDLIISVHAPYKLVDHDGPISFPNLESPLPVRTLGAFPGSLGTYAGVERNIPVVTPELPSAKMLPDLKAVEQLFLFIMKSKF